MTKFNPDFWETTLASANWQRFSEQDGLWYESAEDAEARAARTTRTAALWPCIQAVMRDVLTERQREVVTLHFFAALNQRQIAERLRISQQSVCEHLYGKVRDGRAVGGAIRKLRKACTKRGIRWDM
jgi:DNA-directed RNA polymerase specialized sigma24 family protein